LKYFNPNKLQVSLGSGKHGVVEAKKRKGGQGIIFTF